VQLATIAEYEKDMHQCTSIKKIYSDKLDKGVALVLTNCPSKTLYK